MQWADTELAVLLFPNICRTPQEALEAFNYVYKVDAFSSFRRVLLHYSGGLAMHYMAIPKMRKKYGIEQGKERVGVQKACAAWCAEGLANGGKHFHGGATPDLADIAVYGVLRAVDHTATHRELLAEPLLQTWYERMEGVARYAPHKK